jgi:hypothetical protein
MSAALSAQQQQQQQQQQCAQGHALLCVLLCVLGQLQALACLPRPWQLPLLAAA